MTNRILKSLRALLAIALTTGAVIFIWLGATKVTAQDLPPLKPGDIVFQTSKSSQSAAIFMASNSAYTHMGIIEINSSNEPMVVEAAGPVRSTPLEQWIKRGLGGRIAVKRMETLNPVTAQKVLALAHTYDGKPYDRYFISTTNEIYCSELIRLAFAQGANIEIGKMQKVKDLNVENMLAQRLIKMRWRSYPLCRDNANETLESCKTKIMEQELVTPVSIANDTKLKTIFSNYGLTAQ
jgi:uncharacterized protein YycO